MSASTWPSEMRPCCSGRHPAYEPVSALEEHDPAPQSGSGSLCHKDASLTVTKRLKHRRLVPSNHQTAHQFSDVQHHSAGPGTDCASAAAARPCGAACRHLPGGPGKAPGVMPRCSSVCRSHSGTGGFFLCGTAPPGPACACPYVPHGPTALHAHLPAICACPMTSCAYTCPACSCACMHSAHA